MTTKAKIYSHQKTGIFGGPEVSYHQTYSASNWLSILRTHYPTQNLQWKHRTDLHMKTKTKIYSHQKMGMFRDPEVTYHQTYLARDWLSILRTTYPTQNLQRKPNVRKKV